jgi:Patatin-like phospholipase
LAVEDLRQRLTSLLADNTYWAIFAELEKTPEADRARILRPHDAIRLHELREFEAIRQRAQLDKALGRLTLLEIGFETGLLPEGLSKAQAWLEQDLGDFRKLVTESESFFGYAGAYLYFGARILAYRCFGSCFPQRNASASKPAASGSASVGLWRRLYSALGRRLRPTADQPPQANDSETNRRSFPLAVPPGLDMFTREPAKATEIFEAFVTMSDLLKEDRNEKWKTALSFLDGFQPAGYGNAEGGALPLGSPDRPELYQEPAQYELWLRGLSPDAAEATALRFIEISRGLVALAKERTEFYEKLEEVGFLPVGGTTWINPKDLQEKGVLQNPLTARFALADIYWLARLLRAEVASDATVKSSRVSWLHLLEFKANLEGADEAYLRSLRKYDAMLRLVFSYVCDLAQNAAALTAQRELRYFNPQQFALPNTGGGEEKPIRGWRAAFDEELREIDKQRSRRTYSEPAFKKDEPYPWNAALEDCYWSERLITGRQPHDRIGLAFSGGGIRSATFNLGVLQGLQELNLLRHVDYLSTVSGGGFIGSWLAGNVKRTRQWLTRGIRWDESIAHLRSYSSYLAPLTGILRADTWTLAAIWARNTFLIQLSGVTWLFALLLLALAARMVFSGIARGYPAHGVTIPYTHWLCSRGLHASWAAVVALPLAALVTVNLARNFKNNRVETGEHSPRGFGVRWFAVLPSWLAACFVAAILCSEAQLWQYAPPQSLPLSVQGASTLEASCKSVLCSEVPDALPGLDNHDYSFLFKRAWERLDTLLIAYWVALLFIGQYALVPAKKKGWRKWLITWWRCLWIGTPSVLVLYLALCGLLLLGLSFAQPRERFEAFAFVFGPALVLAAFTLSVVIFIGLSGRGSNEAQREWWTRFGAWLLIFATVGLLLSGAAVLGPKLVFKIIAITPGKLKAIRWGALLGSLGTVFSGIMAGKSSRTAGEGQDSKLDLLARAGGLMFVVVAALATSTVLYLLLLNITTNYLWTDSYWRALNAISGTSFWVVYIVVLFCAGIFSWFFEINIFGLSQLYRNRLVRCYLGATRWAPGARKPHPFTKFDFHDDMDLSELCENFRGPFPIFNCTLNLGGSSDLAVHSRHSASFSLTPLRCGADRPKVGYASTGKPDKPEASFANGVRLGQAVAISGAAVSPNMGYNTSPLVALLLTMFNVRLGWWFPNPGRKDWAERGLRFSLWYLTRELLGTANENRNFLNVSDGGHFENLGVYELIRRRCKVIIACDAECDESLQFGSLGNLVRICATDFGAEIDLDVRSIAQQKEGHSLTHSAVGKIRYGNGSIGYLIYLKASITGDEGVAITQYRCEHPSFPHETTANQFYTEAQFDTYRILGRHTVKHAFRGVPVDEHPLPVAERLADVMAPARTSGEAYLKHTRALSGLWKEFRKSPSLHSFLDELMWIRPPIAVVSPTGAPHQEAEELCAALELIQLMEDVFMDLQLDDFWEHPDNRGWAILFMRWARSPRFRGYWLQTHRTIGIRFEYFCAARLGLARDIPIVRV